MAPRAVVTDHPGSSRQEIDNEPDWGFGHNHRIGVKNKDGRQPGLTHDGDHHDDDNETEQLTKNATDKVQKLKQRAKRGDLVSFTDIMKAKTDFHLKRPEDHPPGWRFMVGVTEDWVKYQQSWPANEKRKAQEQEKQKQENQNQEDQKQSDPKQSVNQQQSNGVKPEAEEGEKDQGGAPQKGTDHHWTQEDGQQDDEESRWKRSQGDKSKHHGAYSSSDSSEKSKEDEEYDKLREKYSPQEIALLRFLRNEKNYIATLDQNDGSIVSPVAKIKQLIDIDVADQFSPDNWIPRSGNLIRNTGKHPLNAEPKLSSLFEAGMITPNELHYVRNHGAVPRLYWEFHKLDIENGSLVLSMDQLVNDFEAVNIAVALACDGNRRGEMNLIRKSKGFTWGAGGISCAYWKGALLRDLLLAAGVTAKLDSSKRRHVNFEGSDELTDGKYATSIPLEYALDPANDVLIAYEMNNVKLPPDHGFPCRLIIPGYVGGRCVKWLGRIWTSDQENDSHYHIWDNRVLPSFITEKDGEFATTMFSHPSTACMEQNLQSIIVKPAEGERVSFADASKQRTYRVQGFAYDGGGQEVQKVELSLDGGDTWLYCIRKYPEKPIRHGNKFWSWLHWYVDIDMGHFLEAKSFTVRCFNVFKNTQPEKPIWNTMGMMNNSYYVVKPQLDSNASKTGGEAALVYRHPVDPEGEGGWMQPSSEVQLQAAKQDTGVPDKQFTREEIEKHDSNDDCWIVINDKVFDATSVLSWHPGGAASIVAYAGRLTKETTSSFESIHDEYATKKLNECVIGQVTDKTSKYMKEAAKAAAQEAAKSSNSKDDILLQSQRWTPVKLTDRKSLSHDTRRYTFSLPEGKPHLGLSTCQHVQFGLHTKDKLLIRSYTPTRPVLPNDESGTFDLVIKTYLPSDEQPGGAFSNMLDNLPIGESVDVRGPTGEIAYRGKGKFDIAGEEKTFSKVSLILGGSGVTPGYQLLARILEAKDDNTQICVVDANKSEDDILMREELDEFAKNWSKQCKITHVLSHPGDDWKGLKGHVNEQIIKENCFAPEEGAAVFLCGPPAMIQKSALPALKDWGYKEDENCFGF